jgi:hypothetical protein
MRSTQDKVCAKCGRSFSWRPKWARNWEQMRFCSARCRSARLTALDRRLEKEIAELLETRATTICPSEVARRVGGDNWRPLMEPTRQAARRLVAARKLEILQRGRIVEPSQAKGPIRLRAAHVREGS